MDTDKRDIKVLIVNDEKSRQEFVKYALEKRGFITENVKREEKVLERISQAKPAIIILDITMPGKDGLEICKQLREEPNTKDIPIIFLSVQRRQSPVDKFIHDMPGAAIEYIEKPYNIKYLIEQVENLTRKSSL